MKLLCISFFFFFFFCLFFFKKFFFFFFFLEEYCFSDSSSIFLISWRFEAKNILKIFLEYRPMVYVCQHGVAFLSLQMIAFIHCATFWYHVTYISSMCYLSRFEARSRCDISRHLDILASKK